MNEKAQDMADEKSTDTQPGGILHISYLDLWRRVYQNTYRKDNPDAKPTECMKDPVPGRTDKWSSQYLGPAVRA
jgi:hypothetical protein